MRLTPNSLTGGIYLFTYLVPLQVEQTVLTFLELGEILVAFLSFDMSKLEGMDTEGEWPVPSLYTLIRDDVGVDFR